MAAVPALDSVCHHALTLIGLICYCFPSALEGFQVHKRLEVSRRDFQLSLIYHGAKISYKDNSNLFDNRQVWGGKNKYQIQQCLLLWISEVKQ